MEGPLFAIIMGALILLFLLWLFYPKLGLLAMFRKGKTSTEKVLMEDVLKYVYDCEYKSLSCDTSNLIEHLNNSDETVKRILVKLSEMNLLSVGIENGIKLTDEGNTYALRVIRVHRIWERYLADETGVSEMEWHPRADDKEHLLSFSDANKLAAQMGNPVFDPHGDPIPTKSGEIPLHKGKSLNNFESGDLVSVLHVEDEPATIYAQLVALGLHAHMKLKIIEVSSDKVRFQTEMEELVLASIFAKNITAVKLEGEVGFEADSERLTALELGRSAKIIGISPSCRGQQRRRLMDLGVIPGSSIKSIMKSPLGEPIAYQVMGATIAFRKEQAEQIFITIEK